MYWCVCYVWGLVQHFHTFCAELNWKLCLNNHFFHPWTVIHEAYGRLHCRICYSTIMKSNFIVYTFLLARIVFSVLCWTSHFTLTLYQVINQGYSVQGATKPCWWGVAPTSISLSNGIWLVHKHPFCLGCDPVYKHIHKFIIPSAVVALAVRMSKWQDIVMTARMLGDWHKNRSEDREPIAYEVHGEINDYEREEQWLSKQHGPWPSWEMTTYSHSMRCLKPRSLPQTLSTYASYYAFQSFSHCSHFVAHGRPSRSTCNTY